MAKSRDHDAGNQNVSHGDAKARTNPPAVAEAAFGYPRDFLGNRFVYVVISPRAGGLSIGINVNPDKQCNFDCVYCEVDRTEPARESHLEVSVMARELEKTLATVRRGGLRRWPAYCALPVELLQLRHVTLSGDGEPTLAPNFVEIVETAVHIRAVGGTPHFKLVLVTNATGLDQPLVQQGLKCLTREDEVWAKLDGGTSAYLQKVNRPDVPIEKILQNILALSRQRPVVIQSLFLSLNGQEPPEDEIQQYALRLKELKAAGAQIPLVQIYSATRPKFSPECGHLSLQTLSRIARTVQKMSGLKAEVF
jgi:wyosine [tRNA(Phe)-imidazoG37] synthetase (radical SAM superfamily)